VSSAFVVAVELVFDVVVDDVVDVVVDVVVAVSIAASETEERASLKLLKQKSGWQLGKNAKGWTGGVKVGDCGKKAGGGEGKQPRWNRIRGFA